MWEGEDHLRKVPQKKCCSQPSVCTFEVMVLRSAKARRGHEVSAGNHPVFFLREGLLNAGLKERRVPQATFQAGGTSSARTRKPQPRNAGRVILGR